MDLASPLADILPDGLGEQWPDFEAESVARERDFHQVTVIAAVCTVGV